MTSETITRLRWTLTLHEIGSRVFSAL